MKTVLDLIENLSQETAAGITEHDRRGKASLTRPYAEVVARARRIGAAFLEAGVQPGDPVFLQLPNSIQLVECFLGAILAGALPCCLAPPRALGGIEAFQARIAGLFSAFPRAHLVADDETGERSGQRFLLAPDPADDAPACPPREADPEDVAFLQLTSGTTQSPRGVQISHRALLANARGICHGGRASPRDAYVSWLPLYHDMGLVGLGFCAWYSRAPLYLFRPETFVARPLVWLQTIASLKDHRVISTAPNFAYQHCVNALPAEKLAGSGLDLSPWRLAGCGAERVRPETLAAFNERFRPHGFPRNAFLPCYGMAEATLAVTFTLLDGEPREVDGHVSCGWPVLDTEVVIRDDAGNPLPDGVDGQITVRGPGLCSGYTGDANVPQPVQDGWLQTGDRGHLRDGELFVTGRYKDLIIVEGHNVDPDEIEFHGDQVVQQPGCRSGAFAVEADGRERAVLVVECGKEPDEALAAWADAIGSRVASALGFKLYDLGFVRRGGLPTTSSGKVQRSKLRDLFLAGELTFLWRQSAQDETA
ncbi:MAG: AMP-binding protein [Planctomycetota bacterium]